MEPSTRLRPPQQEAATRRRGHIPQISISDDNHHVTEAIGDMYGDSDWNARDSRVLSFASSPPADDSFRRSSYFDNNLSTSPTVVPLDSPLTKSLSTERYPTNGNGSQTLQAQRQSSLGSNGSSSNVSQSPVTDTASQHFPLNDIDYESSPAAVAQELSNLQAIRRMSMNVDAADPDLPSFGPKLAAPSSPSSTSSDDDDAARLFWVPARLHPELAPKEFKTFVEERVERIRRRSREDGSLSPPGVDRRSSGSGSLSRRKSMLSKTIENAIGYQDGAEVLERKRSQSSEKSLETGETTLQELEHLVGEQAEIFHNMNIEAARKSLEGGSDPASGEEVPLFPGTAAGQTLKRSTRTNYRRGSLRKGERVAPSRRLASRIHEGEAADGSDSPRPSYSDELSPALKRVQTEPSLPPSEQSENFSRPSLKGRGTTTSPTSVSLEDIHSIESEDRPSPKPFQSRIAANGRTTASIPGYQRPSSVPHIVETPPVEQKQTIPTKQLQGQALPERTSSHEFSRSHVSQNYMPPRQSMQSNLSRTRQHSQTLDEMANNPALMLGTSTRTDALSIIPTFADDRKSDKKSTKERKDGGDSSSRKPSWGWLLGSEDKEKKEKDKEEKESSKKSKSKPPKNVEKSYDSTRLDVLQTASDGSKGRESLVLDRDSLKLEEERAKSRNRKSGESRKDKESSGASSFISSLFGSGKKKADRESSNTESSVKSKTRNLVGRGLSPEPPPRILRADIDYNWTRFSIFEERAIYRMAHIKLANPRRALLSQVLLSNFMYSYLAKVQSQHPQIQIPQFVQQSQKLSSPQQQQQESDEFKQWQRYQEQQERQQSFEQPNSSYEPSDASLNPASNYTASTSRDPVISHSTFVDDFDAGHPQDQDSRVMSQQQMNDGKANGMYGYQAHHMGPQYHHYSQQNHYDDSGGDEDDGDDGMW